MTYQANPRDPATGVGYADGRWFYGPGSQGVPVERLAASWRQKSTPNSRLFERQAELHEAEPTDGVMLELDQIQDALEARRRRSRETGRRLARRAGKRENPGTEVPAWCLDCDRESMRSDHADPSTGRHRREP